MHDDGYGTRAFGVHYLLFFVRVGSIIAWFLFASGTLRVLLGLFFAFGENVTDNAFAARRYLAAASTGEAIDEGSIAILAGVIIGLLVKIASDKDWN